MSSLLAKLLARIGFFIALALVLPLAVQNRQLVDIYLNPFSLLGNQPPAVTLPLFIALLLALGVGLFIGYALGRLGARSKQRAKDAQRAKTADILARMSGVGEAKNRAADLPSMIQSEGQKITATRPQEPSDPQ